MDNYGFDQIYCTICGKRVRSFSQPLSSGEREQDFCQGHARSDKSNYDRNSDPTVYHCQHSRAVPGDKYCRDCGKRL